MAALSRYFMVLLCIFSFLQRSLQSNDVIPAESELSLMSRYEDLSKVKDAFEGDQFFKFSKRIASGFNGQMREWIQRIMAKPLKNVGDQCMGNIADTLHAANRSERWAVRCEY